ncbi:MAG: hypothetical protein ACHQ2E_03605 [Gemmatimonadales bacterium]
MRSISRESLPAAVAAAGLFLAVAAPVAAQQPAPAAGGQHQHDPGMPVEGGGVFPAGWTVRTDEEGQASQIKFVTMSPGWHVTVGTAAIYYRATDQAKAPFTLTTKIHLFPGTGSHQEAFGLFIGGEDLAGPKEEYTYFLIRGDGTFKVKQRDGDKVSDVTPGWTANAAIVQAKADGPVVNVIVVAATADKVSFQVNGKEVWSGKVKDTNGQVGLRINHNLNMHVESLELTK